jgi:hypothetical protein
VKTRILDLVLVISVIAIICLAHPGAGRFSAVAQPQPRSSQVLPTTTTVDELTIGKVSLFGDFWSVLNLQSTVPVHRSELRLFPKSGVSSDQLDPVGGEITISHDDLYNLNGTKDYHVMSIYAYNEEYRIQSQAGGAANAYPIKFDSMGGVINFSLNTDGSLGIARGISNTEGAGGFAHQRVPSCRAQSCSLKVNWPTPFGDTNYTATCTLGGANGTVNWVDKQNDFLLVAVVHSGVGGGGEIDCIGVHD